VDLPELHHLGQIREPFLLFHAARPLLHRRIPDPLLEVLGGLVDIAPSWLRPPVATHGKSQYGK
jgi:hypothetical protein